MPKTTIDGYENVKEIGLTGKYEKYAWTMWKPETKTKDGLMEIKLKVDWGAMITVVVDDYNDGVINGGELMGILTLIGLSVEEHDKDEKETQCG